MTDSGDGICEITWHSGHVTFTDAPTRFGGTLQVTFAGETIAETAIEAGESAADAHQRVLEQIRKNPRVPFG